MTKLISKVVKRGHRTKRGAERN